MNWQSLVNIALQLIPHFLPQKDAWIADALGAIAAYDHNTVAWLQAGLNRVVHPTPALVVDGRWGPKTKAAVEQFEKTLGIAPGGVMSNVVISGLQAALKALPTIGSNHP